MEWDRRFLFLWRVCLKMVLSCRSPVQRVLSLEGLCCARTAVAGEFSTGELCPYMPYDVAICPLCTVFNSDLLLKLVSFNTCFLKVVSSQTIPVNFQPVKLFISPLKS